MAAPAPAVADAPPFEGGQDPAPAPAPAEGVHPHADKYGKLPYHALKVDAAGNPTAKITEVPKDYDVSKNWTLKKDNFETEAVYYRWKQYDAQKRADDFGQKAEDAERVAASGNASKAKRLLEMQRRLDELKQQMADENDDPEQYLSGAVLAPEDQAAAAPAS